MEKASGQKKQSLISLILFMVWPFVIPTIAVVASAWALMAAVQAATDVPTAAAVAFVTLGLAFVSLWASRRAWPVHYVIILGNRLGRFLNRGGLFLCADVHTICRKRYIVRHDYY